MLRAVVLAALVAVALGQACTHPAGSTADA
jgi:hypothetical protein